VKEFENMLTFREVLYTSLLSCFLLTHGIVYGQSTSGSTQLTKRPVNSRSGDVSSTRQQ